MEDILFSNLTPDEIVLLAATLAISLGDVFSDEELLVLANFFVATGVGLLIIVSARALIKHRREENTAPDIQLQIRQLREELRQIKYALQLT